MKIYRHLFALAALIVTALSAGAQSVDDLTPQQARDLIRTSFNAIDEAAITEKVESQYGLQGATMQNYISGDSVLVMSYMIPGYVADPTPEGRAFTEVCIAAGGGKMGSNVAEMVCSLMGKAGYNIRVVYSGGGAERQTIYLTPERLANLWTKPLQSSGIDRTLAREGFRRSIETGAGQLTEDNIDPSLKSLKLKVNGSWVDYIMEFRSPEVTEMASDPEFKDVMVSMKDEMVGDMASDAFLNTYSGIMSYASDFIGVDGLKIKIVGADGNAYPMFFVTWEELAAPRGY